MRRKTFAAALPIILFLNTLGLISFATGGPALADNASCLMCHGSMSYGKPKGDTDPIHDSSGSFLHEPHAALACTDCHTDITEVPHRQGVERKIQCEACHN